MTSKALLELTPDQILKLPSKAVPALISAAIALDRDIEFLATALAVIKGRLIEEAAREAAAAGIKEVKGHSWNFNSDAGESACVIFPLDRLISSFFLFKGQAARYAGEGNKRALIELGDFRSCGTAFDKLFATHYKPAKAFRELCQALLPAPRAAELLQSCSEPSSPRVSFKTK